MTILLYLLKNIIPITLTALAMVVVCVLVNWIYIIPKAKGEGYDKRIADVAVVDAKNDAKSKGNLAELTNKTDYDICVSSLRRKQLPVDTCEQLLGVQPQ